MDAEGYEIRAEKWMDRWVVSARVRLRHEEDSFEWGELLAFQTGHYEWTDPNSELQSLALQIARRLD